MKKRILLTLFLIIGTLSFSNAWSAIAINKKTGQTGYAYGYGARSNAEVRALRECGRNCVVAISFYNSCGAVAWASKTDSKYNVGAGYGDSYDSQSIALKLCRKIPGAKDCKIVTNFCYTY